MSFLPFPFSLVFFVARKGFCKWDGSLTFFWVVEDLLPVVVVAVVMVVEEEGDVVVID